MGKNMTTNIKKTNPKRIPVYVNLIPPCNNACPAGENIQAWLNCLQNGKLYEAWEIIMQNNPFPAIHGRVCYHPCETACNRSKFDATISIHDLERFLGDLALQEKWQVRCEAKKTGKRVLIIGAGPAGLSAAYHLSLLGHSAVIYETESYCGGMMRNGIPEYRLPRDILDGEIDRLKKMGVKIELNFSASESNMQELIKTLCSITQTKDHSPQNESQFDAIFIASGAEKDRTTEILSKNNPAPVLGAVDFLRSIENKNTPTLGKNLAIYGGGNTAIDVARSAKRLGVQNTTIIYRRDLKNMPAFEHEIREAKEEGVNFLFMRTIKEIDNNQLVMEIMEFNEQNKLYATGKFEQINTDMLIVAIGQDPETAFLRQIPNINFKEDGTILVNDAMMTGHDGIFAGGDVITNDRSVTIAVAHGRKAALRIDSYLNNQVYKQQDKHNMAGYEVLHTKDAEKSDSIKQVNLSVNERIDNFKEVYCGIDKNQLFQESKRCFSCGNCFECDSCYNICPVKAIDKLGEGKRYYINISKCIGCGKCFQACPCGAIKMIDNPDFKS